MKCGKAVLRESAGEHGNTGERRQAQGSVGKIRRLWVSAGEGTVCGLWTEAGGHESAGCFTLVGIAHGGRSMVDKASIPMLLVPELGLVRCDCFKS